MKPKVYIETTVISYLAARPSRDLIRAAHQKITEEWWRTRARFDLFISRAVNDEVQRGDPAAARDRLNLLGSLGVLPLNEEVTHFAELLVKAVPLPQRASVDAVHIAAATIWGMDYLLTWNCKHIAHAQIRRVVGEISRSSGYDAVVICTPEELPEI